MSPVTKQFMTPRQQERMARVLGETKRLLGEFGTDLITLRDVAKASQTSEATLYNRFGNKEGLINAAMLATLETTEQTAAHYQGSTSALGRLLHGAQVFSDSILESPGFSRALMNAFFKVEGDRTVPERMTGVVYQSFLPVVLDMEANGLVHKIVPARLLSRDLTSRVFSVAGSWAYRAFPDAQMRDRLNLALLLPLAGISAGIQASDVETRLSKLAAKLAKYEK